MSEATQPYNREQLAQMFDRIVQTHESPYDSAPGGTLDLEDTTCLKRLDLQPTDRLLDFGTGIGRMAMIAARKCAWVTGLDISLGSLKVARRISEEKGLRNAEFLYGALEDPPLERLKAGRGFNKVLILNALSHLPDDLKRGSLNNISSIIERPGRLVLGDQFLFETPDSCRDRWADIRYDGGQTDYPVPPAMVIQWLEETGGSTQVDRLHPLLGVITADFV